jgi:hypothetical protein
MDGGHVDDASRGEVAVHGWCYDGLPMYMKRTALSALSVLFALSVKIASCLALAAALLALGSCSLENVISALHQGEG